MKINFKPEVWSQKTRTNGTWKCGNGGGLVSPMKSGGLQRQKLMDFQKTKKF